MRASRFKHSPGGFRALAMSAIVVSMSASGCMHSSTSGDSADQQERVFVDSGDDHRETVLIVPAEGGSENFDIRPAPLDTALIRVESGTGVSAVVEVLLKGSFPDGCYELHKLDQEPVRDGQRVTLTMRRPLEAICTQVVRPYRFFFTLDRRFSPGSHVITINDRPFTFRVAER